MPVSATQICQAGVPYPTAIEIARQMNAGIGNGNAGWLANGGIPPTAATELARQINAGAFSSDLLAKAGFPPEASVQIKLASGL